MVTFDQAFANTKQDTRLSIKTKLQARGYDLEGELDDSFMGLQEEDLKAAKLNPPETTALRYVLAKITGRSAHEEPPGVVIQKLDRIESKLDLTITSIKLQLRPTSSKLSLGRDPQFRSNVKSYYCIQGQFGMLQCMVLGVMVPDTALCAGHIFPLRLKNWAPTFGLAASVNSPRNGLLWCDCFESVFETWEACLSNGPLPGQVTFHVLNPHLMTKLLSSRATNPDKKYRKILGCQTFGDYNNRLIQFPAACPVDHRPLKRSIAFQAAGAVDMMRDSTCGLPESFDLSQLVLSVTPDQSNARLQQWIQDLRPAVAAPAADEEVGPNRNATATAVSSAAASSAAASSAAGMSSTHVVLREMLEMARAAQSEQCAPGAGPGSSATAAPVAGAVAGPATELGRAGEEASTAAGYVEVDAKQGRRKPRRRGRKGKAAAQEGAGNVEEEPEGRSEGDRADPVGGKTGSMGAGELGNSGARGGRGGGDGREQGAGRGGRRGEGRVKEECKVGDRRKPKVTWRSEAKARKQLQARRPQVQDGGARSSERVSYALHLPSVAAHPASPSTCSLQGAEFAGLSTANFAIW